MIIIRKLFSNPSKIGGEKDKLSKKELSALGGISGASGLVGYLSEEGARNRIKDEFSKKSFNLKNLAEEGIKTNNEIHEANLQLEKNKLLKDLERSNKPKGDTIINYRKSISESNAERLKRNNLIRENAEKSLNSLEKNMRKKLNKSYLRSSGKALALTGLGSAAVIANHYRIKNKKNNH